MVEALLVEALLFGALSILSSAFNSRFMRVLAVITLALAYTFILISTITLLGGGVK